MLVLNQPLKLLGGFVLQADAGQKAGQVLSDLQHLRIVFDRLAQNRDRIEGAFRGDRRARPFEPQLLRRFVAGRFPRCSDRHCSDRRLIKPDRRLGIVRLDRTITSHFQSFGIVGVPLQIAPNHFTSGIKLLGRVQSTRIIQIGPQNQRV